MLLVDQDGSFAERTAHFVRFLVGCLILLGAIASCRWGIRTLLLSRAGRSRRWCNSFSAVNLIVLVSFLLLQGLATNLFAALGDMLGRFMPASERSWPAVTMVGLYYLVIATSLLLLALHALGLMFRFGDRWIDAWQSRLRANGVAESNPRFHASRVFGITVHLLRNLLATALVLFYFLYGFAIFPRTRTFTEGLIKLLGPPLRDADKAFESYVPNLGYLFVILLLGWILRRALKYFFTSVERGTIVLTSFPAEWAEPTYKLSRTVLFLLVLLVSFPYLPGATSPFFRGFSLFFGALLTFGSSGLVGNLLAGILLTYQQAFKLGDVVRIEGVYGKITEKTLLITRVVTAGQEYVAIPNSKVLAASVTNYSSHGLSDGFALGIVVAIGYEVDWRIVHKLLLDGAARTEEIASDPVPQVLENIFGNYSMEYELRAWTKTSDAMFETCAALRRNVLDTFAEAGVEIMTPTILSHRDASETAVPMERFPNRSQPSGIRVAVDPK
jgi:small-conductance mechanosensitive channel